MNCAMNAAISLKHVDMEWILMGDIIKSRIKDQILVQIEFAKLISECNREFAASMKSKLTITLGDEFQGILMEEGDFPRVVSWLEENKWRLSLPIELRYAFGHGEVLTPINPEIAHGMLGPGLTLTRETLNNLKSKTDRVGIIGEMQDRELKQLITELYLTHIGSWNWKDREILAAFFQYHDYKLVAEKLDKDSSLMWRRANSLQMGTYNKLKEALFRLFKISI